MTLKDLKLSATSNNLLENFDLWEELDDKTAEKISGGDIFRFENNTTDPISVTLFNGAIIETTIYPFSQFGTQTVDIPGSQITVNFDEILGEGENFVNVIMTSNQTGIFNSVNSTIVFSLA